MKKLDDLDNDGDVSSSDDLESENLEFNVHNYEELYKFPKV